MKQSCISKEPGYAIAYSRNVVVLCKLCNPQQSFMAGELAVSMIGPDSVVMYILLCSIHNSTFCSYSVIAKMCCDRACPYMLHPNTHISMKQAQNIAYGCTSSLLPHQTIVLNMMQACCSERFSCADTCKQTCVTGCYRMCTSGCTGCI